MTLPHSQLAALRHGRSKELDNADARNKLDAGTAAESASATSTADTNSATPATGATSDARFPGISATLVNAVETADHLVVRRVLRTLPKAPEILSMRGEDDMTLLHLAVMLPPSNKVFVAAAQLIQFRAEINAQNAWGETPLMFAVRAALDCQPSGISGEGNRLRALTTLLEARAEPDRTDASGETILFEAAAYGDGDVCQALLQARAEAATRSRDGIMALDVAHSSPEVLQLLRQADKALEGVEPRPLQEEYLTAAEEPRPAPAAPPAQAKVSHPQKSVKAPDEPVVAQAVPAPQAAAAGQGVPADAPATAEAAAAPDEPAVAQAVSAPQAAAAGQGVPADAPATAEAAAAAGGQAEGEARASAPLTSCGLRDFDARTSRSSAEAGAPGPASPPATPRVSSAQPVELEKDPATIQREAEEEARRVRVEEVASHPLVVIITVRLLPSNYLLAVSVLAGSNVGAVRVAVLEKLALASDLSIIMCEDERDDSFLWDECSLGLAQEVCARLNGDTTGTLFWAPEEVSEEAEEPAKEEAAKLPKEEEAEVPPSREEAEEPPTKEEEVEPPKKKEEEPVKPPKEEAVAAAEVVEEKKGGDKTLSDAIPAAGPAAAAVSPLKERCAEAGFVDLDWCGDERVFQALLDLNATWESASVKTLRQLCTSSGIPLGGVLEKAEMRSRLRQVAIWREMTDFSVENEAARYGIEVIVQFQSRDEIVKKMVEAAYGELQPLSGPTQPAKSSASGRRQRWSDTAKPKAAAAAAPSAASSERHRPQAQGSRAEAKAPAKATPSRPSASRSEQQAPPPGPSSPPPGGSSASASSSQKPATSAHAGGHSWAVPPQQAPGQGPSPWVSPQQAPAPGPSPWAAQQAPAPGYAAPPPPSQQWYGGGFTGYHGSFSASQMHNPQWPPPPPPGYHSNMSGFPSGSREPTGVAGASSPKAEAKEPPGTSTHSQPKAQARSVASAQEQPSATQPKAKAAGKPKAKGKAKSKAKSALSSSSEDDVRGIGKQRKSELGPRVRKALKEFPGYQGDLPPMPEAEQLWTKQELYNFFYTGGFIKPNYKKAAAAPKVPRGLLVEYYRRLGLKRGDKAEVVRRAYRQLALKFHPDKNRDNPDAASKFQEIAAAYETICQVLDGKLEVAG